MKRDIKLIVIILRVRLSWFNIVLFKLSPELGNENLASF